jgi:3-methylcrotonyl-CoA carboxylase alpha subunit
MKALRFQGKLWVHHNGRLHGFAAEEKKSGAGGEAAAADLTAPFSCKVLKVHVKPGQKLAKGDPVLVVEAMKMEYSYASPRDGEIEAVNVQEGAIVSAGTAFVRWKG